MKDEVKICQCCGAKIVKYTFTFNKGLARCLYAIRNYPQGVEIRTLKMTSSMWTNFQKLRYWGLIEPVSLGDKRKGGFWKITSTGLDFLNGKVPISKKVVMYRNNFDSFSLDEVYFKDVTEGYEYRQDYKDQIKDQRC